MRTGTDDIGPESEPLHPHDPWLPAPGMGLGYKGDTGQGEKVGVQGVHVLPIGASERLDGLGRGGAGGYFWQGSVAMESTFKIPRIRLVSNQQADAHDVNDPNLDWGVGCL